MRPLSCQGVGMAGVCQRSAVSMACKRAAGEHEPMPSRFSMGCEVHTPITTKGSSMNNLDSPVLDHLSQRIGNAPSSALQQGRTSGEGESAVFGSLHREGTRACPSPKSEPEDRSKTQESRRRLLATQFRDTFTCDDALRLPAAPGSVKETAFTE
jgi:hypothetical protein